MLTIAGMEIGPGHPCRFIAELSCNHGGDLERAFRLIDAMKDAGADAVKFQAYLPDELVTLRGDGPAPEPWGPQGWTMRTLYQKAATPLDWFPRLAAHCQRIGIPWFSSVFGESSLEVLEYCGCSVYKIAKLDNRQAWLLGVIADTGKPILVSDDGYADYPGLPSLARLYCPGGYPASPHDVRLPADFRTAGYLGLSSHCFAPELPVAAVARGCKLIEMHVMLADEPSELESNVSLNEHQVEELVRSIRRTEEMLG
jgi:pseudaminic acid synthase